MNQGHTAKTQSVNRAPSAHRPADPLLLRRRRKRKKRRRRKRRAHTYTHLFGRSLRSLSGKCRAPDPVRGRLVLSSSRDAITEPRHVEPDRGVSVRAGDRALLLRAVLPRLLAHHPHLHPVVGPPDDPPEAAGLPVRVGLALGGVLRLRRVEGVQLGLGGLRGAGRRVHLLQHQLLLLDRGHRRLPLRLHRQVQPEDGRQPGALLPPHQLGRSAGHHRRRRVPQQDRLQRLRGVGGLVLDPDPGSGPGPVDAADREDLGVPGVPHPPRPLRPHQEAHQRGACCPVGVPPHPGQQAGVAPLLLHGRREAHAHPHHLHRPAHVEHGALRAAAGRLPGQAAPGAGHSARYRQHLTGSSQLHHVCVVYTADPQAPLHHVLLLLLVRRGGGAAPGRHPPGAGGGSGRVHPERGGQMIRRWTDGGQREGGRVLVSLQALLQRAPAAKDVCQVMG